MASIFEYEVLDELGQFTLGAFQAAQRGLVNSDTGEDYNTTTLRGFEPLSGMVLGEWADGTADYGTSPIEVMIVIDTHTEENAQDELSAVVSFLNYLVDEGTIELPDSISDIFGGVRFEGATTEGVETKIRFYCSQREGARVIDIRKEIVYFTDSEGTFGSLPMEEFVSEILPEDTDQPEEEPEEVDEEPEEEPEPEPEEEEGSEQVYEREEPDFSELGSEENRVDPIRSSLEDREGEKLEARAGKETKTVDVRPPYYFEWNLQSFNVRFELQNSPGVDGTRIERIDGGIGWADDLGKIGDEIPGSNFPRTTVYIREYLMNVGPSYALELFNNLAFYGWFISNLYDADYHASSYNNVKTTLYRLQRVYDEGLAPQLVRPIPMDEAESRDLDTMPKVNKGTDQEQDAPWLERKQYYEIVEENYDSEAWLNITGLLYEDEE